MSRSDSNSSSSFIEGNLPLPVSGPPPADEAVECELSSGIGAGLRESVREAVQFMALQPASIEAFESSE
jgi:hypothetical protein